MVSKLIAEKIKGKIIGKWKKSKKEQDVYSECDLLNCSCMLKTASHFEHYPDEHLQFVFYIVFHSIKPKEYFLGHLFSRWYQKPFQSQKYNYGMFTLKKSILDKFQ